MRVTRDLDLAEECVQDAFVKALVAWQDGVPERPGAWLTTVARRRALDVLRREQTMRRALPLLVEDAVEPGPEDAARPALPDDRLRLVFTCCHPALARSAQVSLTLRLLCGLSTADVARAFLVSEPTMAARLTRAKKKISAARIPYRVPDTDELPERVDAVLAVLHLLLTTGHTAPTGDALVRVDLLDRAGDLARMLHGLLPSPEVAGLLALVLLTQARRATRVDETGGLELLEHKGRSRWDRRLIDEALVLVRAACRSAPGVGGPGPYALQAAIAAVHADASTWEETDWREIVALYTLLDRQRPSPVVRLNRAAAVGMAHGPAAGLAALTRLGDEPALAAYSSLPAARAAFLVQLGRRDEARAAYGEALLLTENAVERRWLAERLAGL